MMHIVPAPDDPFSAPKVHDDDTTKIENLRHQSVAAIASMGLRRVDGRVLAVAAGRRLLMRTEGGQLCGAMLSGEAPPRCGDAVAVAGFPETDLFKLNLTRATWMALPPEKSAEMELADDGCGFDPAARPGPAEGHFGLQGAKERLSAIGGAMHVESSPGNGTKVTVEIVK